MHVSKEKTVDNKITNRMKKISLKSVESTEFNEVVLIDYQKICINGHGLKSGAGKG